MKRLHYIILMDSGQAGMSDISGIPMIKEKLPDVDTMMFAIYDDPERIFQSLYAGATGYLLKSKPLACIKESLHSLHGGGSPMSPEIARKVIEKFNPQQQSLKKSPLTDRAKEVVTGLVDGLSYKMIAGRMFISFGTVCQHIKNIYRKLDVHCKAEVISKSFRGEI